MKTKLILLSLLVVAFACKKADPDKALSVVGAQDNTTTSGGGGGGGTSPFTTNTKTILASTNYSIMNLEVTNNTLYLLGSFYGLGSASSRCIVAYDGASFNNVNNNFLSGSMLYSVHAFTNDRLLVGGAFTTSTTPSTRYFGYIPFTSSQVTSYSTINGIVYTMLDDGATCFMGGNISYINSTAGSCAYFTNTYSVGTYGYPLSSGSVTNGIANFDGRIFMGGGYYSGGERNIVYGTGSTWTQSGNGFNGTVYDLELYGGKLYAAGAMTYDGYSSASLNYVNSIASYNQTWQKTGTNNLPYTCRSLTTHGNNLIAACYNGSNGYLYSYNTSTNSWTNCMSGSQTYYRLEKIASFNGKLYGIEKNSLTGVTNFVRFD